MTIIFQTNQLMMQLSWAATIFPVTKANVMHRDDSLPLLNIINIIIVIRIIIA